MPIENELKFILKKEDLGGLNYEILKFEILNNCSYEKTNIWQGYLEKYTRIRKMETQYDEKYTFTYKRKIDGKTLELEISIDQNDFELLKKFVKKKLKKDRITLRVFNDVWDIDFFKNPQNDEIYIIIAEVEMQESQTEPKIIPDFIKKYLIYKVPNGDKRFSSKSLCDINKAKKLYSSLICNNIVKL